MQTPAPSEDLENLNAALELAVRTEDYREAARLRDQILAVEAANPIQAAKYRLESQVRSMLDKALYSDESLESRVAAIRSLKELASPPGAADGAEDALHKILCEVKGQSSGELREAVADALWACWLSSGDAEVDAALQKGVQLLNTRDFKEAAKSFTQVIDMDPYYAEAWNKRATVWYLLKEYQRSIDDCMEVLKLKPRHFGCLSGLGMCYLSQGRTEEGVRWMKAALDVHPGIENARQVVSQVGIKDVIAKHLQPEILKTVEAVKKGIEVVIDPNAAVSCDWETYRVADPLQKNIHRYFFRLKYKSLTSSTAAARSFARYYVMQFENGDMFPLTRLTEEGSPAQFTLSPGEEYKFCWMIVVSQPIKGMTGGTLFEMKDDGKSQPYSLTRSKLAYPKNCEEVSASQLEVLTKGHYYSGVLDLRPMGK